MLNSFIDTFALDIPQFMNCTNKEKANILLRIIGVGDKLAELENKETETYNRRHAIGQIADQKSKHAAEMTFYENVPQIPITASELISQQQEILARNGENQRKRQLKAQYDFELEQARQKLDEAKRIFALAQSNAIMASKSAENLIDESTAELEKSIAEIDIINTKIRANLDKEKAEEEAKEYKEQYDILSNELDNIRKEKYDLLHGADLPLDNLSVEGGELTYKNQKWDNMSGSEQLRVATAIVRQLNPECGFVLLDKLEQMDTNTLSDFGLWLESEGLQAIATRVSTGSECSIIIEDGYSHEPEPVAPLTNSWKAGTF